jgi:hypothetical protein
MTLNVHQPTESDSVPLAGITGEHIDIHAISEVGYATISGMYDRATLRDIVASARQLRTASATRFLNLTMLRSAHRYIETIRELMHSTERLMYLSEIAGTPLEPYPIDIAASHVNYYSANEPTIDFHSDGAAIVELIPLDDVQDRDAATLIYNGKRDEGVAMQIEDTECGYGNVWPLIRVAHDFGTSILLQGRRLYHAGSITSSDRTLLVLAMRAVNQPWKDDNTISRLAMDYEVEDFLDDWVKDELNRKLPAYRKWINAKEENR